MNFACEICNIGFTSEGALKAHKTSEKHLSRAEAFHSCLLEAAHSVHVTGFSRNVGKDALYNYFMQFGKVVDVTYVDQNNSWVSTLPSLFLHCLFYPVLIKGYNGDS
ncbi:speckle targeted PIP5K1A-regulated poly(A) polymerase-like [Octopus bimaculoides]|uniref:speckle targeted PIP5K1A-regulated poly(A) polymerase-like n=1 Tax=Octopus bimaculoides TaxID=37653 RepID=UPI00071C7F11|nr:speckle targeted PIP5K1A-regulated poly(A) polymerase-like [Octopus bimaculoides]|eukprot:XP_014790624.1 PREDICTED: speckle targeted PIP5K1A-regulated poly(A) polymerase-like [Octopus bimaculoides]